MSNFGSFRYFQTSLSLGVEQGLQKLPKFDINDLKLLFHCYILISRKCPRKTPFKTQCPPPPYKLGFPRDGMSRGTSRDKPGRDVPLSWDKKVLPVPLSLCPETKNISCPGVPLSRNKGRSKCPGTNSSVPGRPGTK